MKRLYGLALFLAAWGFPAAVSAADWIHWRGPEQSGHSRETNLPADFDPEQGAEGNVIWTQPYGGRMSPLIMDGRVYIQQGTGSGLEESEQVLCFDEKTGKPLWNYRVNVFHTDIVSTRLSWAPLTADPSTGYVYAQTTGGLLLCLDKTGKLVWQHSLTEEYGRASGYGGRLPGLIYDSGLVIAPMVSSSWGDFARGTNRMVAFDAKTGEVVWWHDTINPSKETYCSHPIVTVINGQRVLVTGGADGYIHAIKVRNGEGLWNYQICSGAVNGSPVAVGNLIYCAHGDENPEGGPYGRLVCLDAGQLDPQTGKPKVVWDTYNRPYKVNRNRPLSSRFGLASIAVADGRVYAPDDIGQLYCFNAKNGELLWRYHYATEVRGSPLIADGKLYIFDVKSRLLILQLDGDKQPDELDTFEYRFREPRGIYTETNSSPIAVNGRVYFVSAAALWCIGTEQANSTPVKYPPLPPETPFDENAKPASIRVFPADVVAKPGETKTFVVKFLDANGRELPTPKDAKVEWSLPLPAKTPTGAQPPELKGTAKGAGVEGSLTLAAMPLMQQGHLVAKSGGLSARVRVRVAGQIPAKLDFEKLPNGASPGGWVNANGKYVIKKLPDGNTVIAKGNTNPRPPLAKANGYITLPDHSNYTIQADQMGTVVRGGMGDFGLINSRYTFMLDGKTDPEFHSRVVRLSSWEARPRVDLRVPFDWKPGAWYTLKLTVEPKEKTALVRAKVWEKGKPEPEAWTIEFEDPNPNREGAAGLYGYVTNSTATEPGADCYYDNIQITPNAKK